MIVKDNSELTISIHADATPELHNNRPIQRQIIKTEACPSLGYSHMSIIMRKPAFCICENKDVDQLPSNCEADQCFVFTT